MRAYFESLKRLVRASGWKFLAVWIPGVLAVIAYLAGLLERYFSRWIPAFALELLRGLTQPLLAGAALGLVVCVFLAFHDLRMRTEAGARSALDSVLGGEFRKQVAGLSQVERAALRYLAVNGQALPQQVQAHLAQRQLQGPADPLASVEASTQLVARDFRGHYRINQRYQPLLDAWLAETLE